MMIEIPIQQYGTYQWGCDDPNTVSFEDGKTLKYYIRAGRRLTVSKEEEQGVYCICERSGEESEEGSRS